MGLQTDEKNIKTIKNVILNFFQHYSLFTLLYNHVNYHGLPPVAFTLRAFQTAMLFGRTLLFPDSLYIS